MIGARGCKSVSLAICPALTAGAKCNARFRGSQSLVGLVIMALLLVFNPKAVAQSELDQIINALQAKYNKLSSLAADFTQVYTPSGGRAKRESGRLLLKKPGKMRWDYKSPEVKEFVSNGMKTYFYVPEDKQVFVASLPADDSVSTRILFLAGKGNLARDFTPSLVTVPAGAPTGSRALKLVPKAAQADFEWLMLFVDPATLALRGLASTDAQGGTSTFTFNNVKENVGLDNKLFEFKIPRGVDLISDGR